MALLEVRNHTRVPLTEQQEIFVGRAHISARIEQLLLDRRRPPLFSKTLAFKCRGRGSMPCSGLPGSARHRWPGS